MAHMYIAYRQEQVIAFAGEGNVAPIFGWEQGIAVHAPIMERDS